MMVRWRGRHFVMRFFCEYVPFSYVLLLLLIANSSRVILEEWQMWLDIDNIQTAKSALETANLDTENMKPFSISDVNSILRITELDFQCSEDRPPWLLVLVFSRAHSRSQRDDARSTWIERLLLTERPGTVKIVFVVGVKKDVDLVRRVRDEYRARRDMLVLLMNEAPEDALIKLLAAFQWVNEACHSSTHILKVDDDTYIDVDRFLRFVRTTAEHTRYKNSAMIFGQCLTDVKVNRNPQLKRYIPETIYPNSTYPTFCTGAAYLMNQETLTLILSNIFTLPNDYLIPFEDILVTGILAQPNTIHVAHPGFMNAQVHADKFCLYRKVFAVISEHGMENFLC